MLETQAPTDTWQSHLSVPQQPCSAAPFLPLLTQTPGTHACALDSYSRLRPHPPPSPALQSLVHLLCLRGPRAEERETAWAPSGVCVFLMARSSLTFSASRTSFMNPALRHPVPPRPACSWHLGCLCGRRMPPGPHPLSGPRQRPWHQGFFQGCLLEQKAALATMQVTSGPVRRAVFLGQQLGGGRQARGLGDG